MMPVTNNGTSNCSLYFWRELQNDVHQQEQKRIVIDHDVSDVRILGKDTADFRQKNSTECLRNWR